MVRVFVLMALLTLTFQWLNGQMKSHGLYGKKIFEGDILEAHLDDSFPENVTRVRVTWENMKWCMVQKGMIPDPFETGEGKDWEVIGNIYDTLERV